MISGDCQELDEQSWGSSCLRLPFSWLMSDAVHRCLLQVSSNQDRVRGQGENSCRSPKSPQASCPMTTSTPRFLSFFLSVFYCCSSLEIPRLARKVPFQLLVEIYTSLCFSVLSKENQRIFFLCDLEIMFQGSSNGLLMGFDFLRQF